MVKSLCTNFSPPLVSLAPPGLDDTTPTSTSSDDSKDVATSTVEVYHPFPSPSTLISPSVETTLRTLGFGYRASYIQRTASLLVSTHGASGAEPFLCSLRTRPTATAREELLKFVGVGRKVADCVLLMSLDKREVVPVDTHVQQIAAKHYGLSKAKGGMTPKLYEEVNMKLVKTWGDWAGWAHSVSCFSLLSLLNLPIVTGFVHVRS
jgi:N-glycosylase/DNA lyase